jgi:hypothetical protein
MDKHNIDNVIIPFNKSWKNVAISVSGGADSALLAFLICNIVKTQTVHIISHRRMWKTRPWQSYDSERVFIWLQNRFPNIHFKRHTSFIAPDIEYGNMGPIIQDEYGKMVSGCNAQIRSYSEYICFTHNIEAYFNGVTRNPKGIDLGGMVERNIDPNDNNKHLEIMEHMEKWVIHPFRFKEKSWVVKQYKDNDIMDLFNLTRSCEGEFLGLDYTTYNYGDNIPVCNECFWCKEREWAIEQNK